MKNYQDLKKHKVKDFLGFKRRYKMSGTNFFPTQKQLFKKKTEYMERDEFDEEDSDLIFPGRDNILNCHMTRKMILVMKST